jgi:hypothetical protein
MIHCYACGKKFKKYLLITHPETRLKVPSCPGCGITVDKGLFKLEDLEDNESIIEELDLTNM